MTRFDKATRPLRQVLTLAFLLTSFSCAVSHEPFGTTSEASVGVCPVHIEVPSQGEATGRYVQISVSQSCASWTDAMIAYVDGQRCDEAPYPFPNPGCKVTGQSFAPSTWVEVTPGSHTIIVNNWSSSGAVGVSSPVSFHYTPSHLDGGSDGHVDGHAGGMDSSSDAPSGTVTVSDLDQHLFQIANGGADHCKTVGSHQLCAGSCNGACAGSGALSSYSIETGVVSPAEASTSTRVDVKGASTDTLEWVKVDPAAKGTGSHRTATHFTWDFYIYPTTTSNVQAYEFDAFYGSNGYWLMMGTQCDLALGNWNGWNEATGHWVTSSIQDCGSFFRVGEWNHIVLRVHRDVGSVGASTQYYYDDLEVNGTHHAFGLGGFHGTNKGWGDVVGVQVQQDLEASFSGTLSTYYDSFTLDISP
jgi:hypothetical protein